MLRLAESYMVSPEEGVALAASFFKPPLVVVDQSVRLDSGSQVDEIVNVARYIARNSPSKDDLHSLFCNIDQITRAALPDQHDPSKTQLLMVFKPAWEFERDYQPGGEPIRRPLWPAGGHAPLPTVFTAILITFKNK